eukprot:GHVU01069562.1.p3 GENE.GHVU01069562.1~~GHVU01069562.1.p3  ORF type:complete len:135 (-),score=34.57 GHVU01069562.1:398-802(-)
MRRDGKFAGQGRAGHGPEERDGESDCEYYPDDDDDDAGTKKEETKYVGEGRVRASLHGGMSDGDSDDILDERCEAQESAEQLKKELVRVMEERFLCGINDGLDVEYDKIENDSTLDGYNRERDMDLEEEYFEQD